MNILKVSSSAIFPKTSPAIFYRSAELTSLLNGTLATRLFDFQGAMATEAGDELWCELQGCSGLKQICSDCGTAIKVCKAMRSVGPLAQDADRIIGACRCLRFAVLGCLVESAAASIWDNVPRFQAMLCANAYCDIHSSLTAAVEIWGRYNKTGI